MTLGELRDQLGVPQAEVAARLGLTLAAVAALDAVRVNDASGNTLALWAAGLGGALVVELPGGRRVRL